MHTPATCVGYERLFNAKNNLSAGVSKHPYVDQTSV